MALTRIAPGEIATVVTTLEMRTRPLPRPLPSAPLRLLRWAAPDAAMYRTLFQRVGGPWLWFSRLVLDDEALLAIVRDPAVEVYAATDRAGIEVGMVELNRRVAGSCEINYFALVPELTGRGLGRWLMAHTLGLAWRPDTQRVWLHTCTLDHPRALGFYRAQGFVAVDRWVETFVDPRIAGVLPRDAAPHVPLLDPQR